MTIPITVKKSFGAKCSNWSFVNNKCASTHKMISVITHVVHNIIICLNKFPFALIMQRNILLLKLSMTVWISFFSTFISHIGISNLAAMNHKQPKKNRALVLISFLFFFLTPIKNYVLYVDFDIKKYVIRLGHFYLSLT